MKILRAACIGSNFTGSCHKRRVNFQELFTYPSFGKLCTFSLACSNFLSKHQVIGWNCYICIFLIRIKKSQFWEIKWRNLQNIANFLKTLGYQVKSWTKYVPNNVKNSTVRQFNKLLYFFYFMKKSCLVMSFFSSVSGFPHGNR